MAARSTRLAVGVAVLLGAALSLYSASSDNMPAAQLDPLSIADPSSAESQLRAQLTQLQAMSGAPFDALAWLASHSRPQQWAPAPVNTSQWLQCMLDELAELRQRSGARYTSPPLAAITAAVNAGLQQRNKFVSAAVFWGRTRYVEVLWPYLARNLRVNGGVLDEVLLACDGTCDASVRAEAVAAYPSFVRVANVSHLPYTSVFSSILTNDSALYIKLDDDIVFIKDGTFEHLAFNLLFNDDYAFYTANVVNNPLTVGMHSQMGAWGRKTYHWTFPAVTGRPVGIGFRGWDPWWLIHCEHGSMAHEAFVSNAAGSGLDAYGFDVFNLHQCKVLPGW